jgi:hypothetical protein
MIEIIKSILLDPAFTSAIVTALVGLIGATIAFLGKQIKAILGARLSAEQLRLLMEIASRAVLAAEQVYADGTAEQKKAEALRAARAFLVAYGLRVGDKQLDAAIEAAVLTDLVHGTPPDPVPDEPAEETPEA